MVAQHPIVVKLADEQQAVVDYGRISIEDARGYTPRLVAVIELEDAITLAKAILAFAEPNALSEVERR